MTSSYASPGVYREDIVVRPVATMATGVPGFVGFGSAENPLLVRHLEELGDRFGGEGYVSSAVSGFFANGGVRCYVVGAEHSNGEAGLIKAALSR